MNEKELEKIFKALANKRRLKILKFLKTKAKSSVGNIASAIKLSFKATSKHLHLLTSVDILDKTSQSTRVYYHINKSTDNISKKVIEIL